MAAVVFRTAEALSPLGEARQLTLEMDKHWVVQQPYLDPRQKKREGGRFKCVQEWWGKALGPSVCLGGWEAASLNDMRCKCLAPTWL